MKSLPPPPVPQKLRELLKDYPDLIERLQDVLDVYFKNPSVTLPFDGAIWVLEARLGTFIDEARESFKAAEANGDEEMTREADERLDLMFRARSRSGSGGLGMLDELWDYCQLIKERVR